MATIGTLAVNIIATTDKFIAGLNSANSAIMRFVKKFSTAANLVGGLGLYAFGQFFTNAIEFGGAIADLSKKIGVSAEALQVFDYAAEQVGTNVEAVHAAMLRLDKSIGMAATGSREMQRSFRQLGIDFRALQKLSDENQFLAVLDALRKMPSDARRAAIGSTILGKGVSELNNLIEAGSAEIIKFGDEAIRMGAILDGDAAERLDAASDAMARFGKVAKVQSASFASQYAPEIEFALDVIGRGVQILMGVLQGAQVVVIGFFSLILLAAQGAVKAINLLLPKAIELPTQAGDALIGALDVRGNELIEAAKKNFSGTGTVANPLAESTTSTANNTARIASTMDRLLARMERTQSLGVR
jgi:methyl-accepting chemotaxis protein